MVAIEWVSKRSVGTGAGGAVVPGGEAGAPEDAGAAAGAATELLLREKLH